jgi:hypothetical protein
MCVLLSFLKRGKLVGDVATVLLSKYFTWFWSDLRQLAFDNITGENYVNAYEASGLNTMEKERRLKCHVRRKAD